MKKFARSVFALALVFAMVASYFWPLTNVIAEDHGTEGPYYLTVGINNVIEAEGVTMTVNGFNWVDQSEKFYDENDSYHIEITVTGTGEKTPYIEWGGNWNDYVTYANFHENGTHSFVLDITNTDHQTFLGLSVKEQVQQQQPDPNQGQGENPGQGEQGQGQNDPQEPHFDGKAYLLWSCKNGGICMYHFDNIPNYDDGNSTFYKASDIVDARTGEKFNVDAQYRGFATDARFDDWVTAYKAYKNVNEINWANVNPEDMLGAPRDMRQFEDAAIAAGACNRNTMPADEFMGCVDNYAVSQGEWVARAQLQPVGEPEANNAYVSYGDRNFKVVIYNDEYKGVSLGDLSELSYYPDYFTNPFIRRDQYDISGTTKDKPTGIDTILLEKVVRIKALNYNGFEIQKIEALDVPADAVEITKVGDEYRLEFSSNFYDKVVFKITDTNGGESFVQIKRTTIDAWIKMDNDKPVLTADFYFDKERSYEDFEITAKIYFKDGSIKKVKLEAWKDIDDGLGNITHEYEVLDGKGLKKASFNYRLNTGDDKNIKDVYLNAEYKGSTESTYAGAYVGSGEGVLANIYHGEE